MYANVLALGVLEDFDFVIRIVVFSYLLYWLYMTFNELPVLFGISALVAGFFMLFYSFPTIFLVILFFLIVVMGSMLQQLLLFGVYPLMQLFGVHPKQPGMGEFEEQQMKVQEIEKKMLQNKALSSEEQALYGSHMDRQMKMQQTQQELSMKRLGPR
ncbi:MAG: hypothetical protein ACE5DI_01780 [Candidatus Micrarchaeia archaeon]